MFRLVVSAALFGVLAAAPAAAGELYKWVDERGRFHMTDDLSQVPPQQRPAARVEPVDPDAPATPSRWNSMQASSHGYAQELGAVLSPGDGAVHVIRIKRAGRAVHVVATLNGHGTARYMVDTGASINTIPRSTVERLGIRIDESTPRTFISGIGGKVMKVPVVTLRSVEIGGARVENVEMAVLDTLREGLLGMPFFNHFRVSLDPTAGTLTLEEIDLNGIEGVYGGYDESTWRQKFGMLHSQIDGLERRLRITPDESYISRGEIEELSVYWRKQLQALERKARQAGVPRTWRE